MKRFVLAATLASACNSSQSGVVHTPTNESQAVVASAAGQRLEANWKERLAQPYAYVEHVGDYRRLGDSMRALFAAAAELELETSGPPFALFFDDPGQVPIERLRARACLPIAQRGSASAAGLQYDDLPRAMVVYARVGGPYPDVAGSYPVLFAYLRDLGWSPGGPIREIYLVNPKDVSDYRELLTEVQIPWAARGN